MGAREPAGRDGESARAFWLRDKTKAGGGAQKGNAPPLAGGSALSASSSARR
jgi:hypothetical protein